MSYYYFIPTGLHYTLVTCTFLQLQGVFQVLVLRDRLVIQRQLQCEISQDPDETWEEANKLSRILQTLGVLSG